MSPTKPSTRKPCSSRPIEAATTMPLSPPIDHHAAVEHLLSKLYDLALKGNVSAAKLYLDYVLKLESREPEGVTTDEVLRMLQAHPQ